MEPLQSNWLFLTLRKTGFLMQVSFSATFYEGWKKIKSMCICSRQLSCLHKCQYISQFFFKLHYWLMWKTTQKQIWCFCASAQYCHNIALLTADLVIKITMSTQEQELKKFLEMLAGMRPKFCEVLFHRGVLPHHPNHLEVREREECYAARTRVKISWKSLKWQNLQNASYWIADSPIKGMNIKLFSMYKC